MFEKIMKMFKIYKFAASSTLADGTEIRIDGNGEAGSVVYIMTPDGEILCPPGEYTLENGDLMEVDENGMIVKITPKDEVEVIEEPIVEEQKEMEVQEQVEASEEVEVANEPEPQTDKGEELFNKVSDLEARIAELETKIASLVQASEETKQSTEQLSKQTNQIIDVLDKTSTAVELKKNDAEPITEFNRMKEFSSKPKTNLSSFSDRLKK